MKRERSLARHLMLSLTGALIAFWLIAIAISIQVMREEYDEVFDSALQGTTERLLSLVASDLRLRNGTGSEIAIEPGGSRQSEYLTYQARRSDGSIVLKSRDAPEAPFDAPLAVGFHDTERHRIYTAADTDLALFVQVADRFSHRREAVRESAVTMLIPLIVLVPGSYIAIWLIVRRATKSIDTLRDAIATKDSGNLAPIENADLPRELKPIMRSVNLLLQRLRAALDAEREFTANSAHELRTPIAGALAHSQVLVRELPEGPTRNRALTLESALSGLGRLAEKLLQLSRADSGIGTKDSEVDLLGILDLIVRDFERNRETAGQIRYDDTSGGSLTRSVDADAFAIVMRNIIENALIHRDPGTPVEVSISDDGVIRVTNDCPVIPAAEMAHLKKRFHRGKTKASGSGLGLPIAERIVTQMGGVLELSSPATGRTAGFEANVVL